MGNLKMTLSRIKSGNIQMYERIMNLREQHACVMALPQDVAKKVTEMAMVGMIRDGEARILEIPAGL